MRTKSGRIPPSSRRHAAAAATAATVAALVLITGCGKAGGGHPSDSAQASATADAPPAPSVNPSYGEQFLAEGECAAAEPGRKGVYREVPCDGPDAIVGGFDYPCDGEADAMFTENSLIDDDPVHSDRLLCADKL